MTDKCLFINARHFDELKILTMQADGGSAAAGGPAANNATPSAAKSGWCFTSVVYGVCGIFIYRVFFHFDTIAIDDANRPREDL